MNNFVYINKLCLITNRKTYFEILNTFTVWFVFKILFMFTFLFNVFQIKLLLSIFMNIILYLYSKLKSSNCDSIVYKIRCYV